MKKSKLTEQQIIFAPHQAETGVKVSEVCRKIGIREAAFFK
jgi:putative transposase